MKKMPLLASVAVGLASLSYQAIARDYIDPIERAYSEARMWGRRTKTSEAEKIHAYMRQKLQAKTHLARARYDLTVGALEAVFPPEELFIGFYETLFAQEALDRLTAFLGVSPREGNLSRRLNVTASAGPLPETLAAEAREVFAPVYSFAGDRFGAELPDAWHS